MPDGSAPPPFAPTDLLLTPLERRPDRRGLERELDGLIAAHWAEVTGRLSVQAEEFNEDMRLLDQLAAALLRAGTALSALTRNNLSADSPTLTPEDGADILDDALDGLLHVSAARVLSAAIKVRLAGGEG
jgi:hypothetical protein